MEGISSGEQLVKVILVLILVLSALAYWGLPRTRLVKRSLPATEKLFVLSSFVGIGCGAVGLIFTFLWPGPILEMHLWELIILPFFLVFVVWGIARRVHGEKVRLDEKQDLDMTKAGACTIPVLILAMGGLFMLTRGEIGDYLIWYPFFLFVTVFSYSLQTLLFFRRV